MRLDLDSWGVNIVSFIVTNYNVLQAFQFNSKYLIAIHDHVYSCQFGTFIGNCQRERQELKLSEKTYSLWGFLTNSADEYVNPLFDQSGKVTLGNKVKQLF